MTVQPAPSIIAVPNAVIHRRLAIAGRFLTVAIPLVVASTASAGVPLAPTHALRIPAQDCSGSGCVTRWVGATEHDGVRHVVWSQVEPIPRVHTARIDADGTITFGTIAIPIESAWADSIRGLRVRRDLLAVGSDGGVHVFRLYGHEWIKETVLFNGPLGGSEVRLTIGVDDDGVERIAVSSPSMLVTNSPFASPVQVHRRDADGWSVEAIIPANTSGGGSSGGPFASGVDVAIDGRRLIIGAPRYSTNGPLVFDGSHVQIHDLVPTGWTLAQFAQGTVWSAPATGHRVAIVGDTIVALNGEITALGNSIENGVFQPTNLQIFRTGTSPCDADWGMAECPDDGIPEGEPCGGVSSDGCNTTLPGAFVPIACGQTICGTAWADGGLRDTDWFELTLATTTTVTFTGTAAFPLRLGILNTGGVPDCALATAFLKTTTALPGATATLNATLAPGTWWLWVGPSIFDGHPCGSGTNDYVVTLRSGVASVPSDFLGTPTTLSGRGYELDAFATGDDTIVVASVWRSLHPVVNGAVAYRIRNGLVIETIPLPVPLDPDDENPTLDTATLDIAVAHRTDGLPRWLAASAPKDPAGPSIRIIDLGTPEDDPPAVIGDLNGDGIVDGADLGILLSQWGPCARGPCVADLNDDGVVDGADLGILLASWTGGG